MVQPCCRGGATRWTGAADAVGTRHLGCEMVGVRGAESASSELMITDQKV